MEGDIFFGFQSYFIAILKDSAFCPRSNPRRRRMPLMETVFQQLSSSRFGSRLSLSTKTKCARNSSALVDSLDRTGYWPEIMERLERARAALCGSIWTMQNWRRRPGLLRPIPQKLHKQPGDSHQALLKCSTVPLKITNPHNYTDPA